MRRVRQRLTGSLLALACASTAAIESDPLPVPPAGPRAAAVVAYNEGVGLLVARQFAPAQTRFEAALKLDEQLAEAHNNLAFTLRMQGRHNFAASLAHYNRAIELKPTLAQAYMYRGVLFTQQGDLPKARLDLERLRGLDAKLAAELDRVISGSSEGNSSSGVAGQYD